MSQSSYPEKHMRLLFVDEADRLKASFFKYPRDL